MELFDNNGSYKYRSFVGSSGTWKIVGTEEKKTVKLTLDTFKSESGEERTYKREQVMEQFRLGNIQPVADSIITFTNYSKKQWDQLTGRADK